MKVKVQLVRGELLPSQLPKYHSEGASGLDLRAAIPEPVPIRPLERILVPTGISVAIPPGYEGQVRPRSGLALRKGITVLNAPGTIDSDYRGEIKVILINLSEETHQIQPGDRIAQIVFAPVARIEWELVDELPQTSRNSGGFGSTGEK